MDGDLALYSGHVPTAAPGNTTGPSPVAIQDLALASSATTWPQPQPEFVTAGGSFKRIARKRSPSRWLRTSRFAISGQYGTVCLAASINGNDGAGGEAIGRRESHKPVASSAHDTPADLCGVGQQ